MYRITNTADDRRKHLQHRTAPQFELEPNLGGRRIRLGTYYDITPEHYERVKPLIDTWVKKGMVEVRLVDSNDDLEIREVRPRYNAERLRLGGPTLEQWVAAGYLAVDYPPEGFAEVFSPGLVTYKIAMEEEAKEFSKAAASVITDALNLPSITEQLLPATPVEEQQLPSQSAEPPIPEQPAPAPIPMRAAAPPLPPPPVSAVSAKVRKTLR